jgi:hypothetical protein
MSNFKNVQKIGGRGLAKIVDTIEKKYCIF